ncbi:MAG: RecX family transcriptional regulator [Sandarakinorhabdus sp.]|nr:RecX family transcriptional regulator [Sandarakinorhabdus sp.]
MPPATRSRRPEKPPSPLDPAALDAIAVRHVERFQTTRARLVRLLRQKLRERGWVEDGPAPEPEQIADRMVELGYISDAAFAEARTRGLQRRGMGLARVRASLSAHGVGQEDSARAMAAHRPVRAALDFARRKRLGPFGPPATEQKTRERQFAAMVRAGHPPRLAHDILRAETVEAAEAMLNDAMPDEEGG